MSGVGRVRGEVVLMARYVSSLFINTANPSDVVKFYEWVKEWINAVAIKMKSKRLVLGIHHFRYWLYHRKGVVIDNLKGRWFWQYAVIAAKEVTADNGIGFKMDEDRGKKVIVLYRKEHR